MESKTVEESLRKNQNLFGTWLRLGDGETWCFSPMPLGKGGNTILSCLERLFACQEGAAKKILAGEQSNALVLTAKDVLDAAREFAFTALKINYPGLTCEYFDENNLCTIRHINQITRIVQGENEISELIGGQEKNALPATAGK